EPDNWRDVFREATWDEALDLTAGALRALRDTYGRRSLAGFGSAKGTNEEAYLFQKLVRVGFGSNNVDHCTRLCHASSVAALMEGIGSGDRKSTRLNSSHLGISYAVFCLKKKKNNKTCHNSH